MCHINVNVLSSVKNSNILRFLLFLNIVLKIIKIDSDDDDDSVN